MHHINTRPKCSAGNGLSPKLEPVYARSAGAEGDRGRQRPRRRRASTALSERPPATTAGFTPPATAYHLSARLVRSSLPVPGLSASSSAHAQHLHSAIRPTRSPSWSATPVPGISESDALLKSCLCAPLDARRRSLHLRFWLGDGPSPIPYTQDSHGPDLVLTERTRHTTLGARTRTRARTEQDR